MIINWQYKATYDKGVFAVLYGNSKTQKSQQPTLARLIGSLNLFLGVFINGSGWVLENYKVRLFSIDQSDFSVSKSPTPPPSNL
jgi:hypothetical protein